MLNKELIKKYQKEFNHWLNNENDSSILVKYVNLNYAPDGYQDWHEDGKVFESNLNYLIVINDKYVEFRKALAEGKTIQMYCNIEEEWFDSNNVIKECGFHCSVESYRIKPDKHKFKSEDWVKIYFSDGKSSDDHYIKQVEYCEEDFIQCTDGSSVYFKNTKIEPWIPEKNELYWDLYNNHLCKCTSVMKSKSGEETVFGVTILPTKLTQECLNDVNCLLSTCEPYLGERPKWINLKDLK